MRTRARAKQTSQSGLEENVAAGKGGQGATERKEVEEAPDEVSLSAGKTAEMDIRAQRKRAEGSQSGRKSQKRGTAEQQINTPVAAVTSKAGSLEAPDVLPPSIVAQLSEPVMKDSMDPTGGNRRSNLSGRTSKQSEPTKRKAPGSSMVEKGPIQVCVLGAAAESKSSETALSFLQDRMNFKQKRSHTMLVPQQMLRQAGPALKFV
mmetsp:Transcript_28693/g.80779  ORF Transcript_28693/g.80779 Transcript_28693/m.80779 type:complete len:206 (+) Transcript_28693:369-986(+)